MITESILFTSLLKYTLCDLNSELCYARERVKKSGTVERARERERERERERGNDLLKVSLGKCVNAVSERVH